jgi:hypothetical protein
VAVGYLATRVIVAAASYAARRFGGAARDAVNDDDAQVRRTRVRRTSPTEADQADLTWVAAGAELAPRRSSGDDQGRAQIIVEAAGVAVFDCPVHDRLDVGRSFSLSCAHHPLVRRRHAGLPADVPSLTVQLAEIAAGANVSRGAQW